MGIHVMGEHKWAHLYDFCTSMSVSPANLLKRSDYSEVIASKRGNIEMSTAPRGLTE